ncbi:MAG: hypothetical protein ACRCZF_24905 [Gemmataceae bacterium]
MNSSKNQPQNGGSSVCVPRVAAKKAPRVVLGLGNSGYAHAVASQLRAIGFDVMATAPGEEARRAAVRTRASVVVFHVPSTETRDTLLDLAKLTTAVPLKTRVLLVGSRTDAAAGHLAGAIGAAGQVDEAEGAPALVRLISLTIAVPQ